MKNVHLQTEANKALKSERNFLLHMLWKNDGLPSFPNVNKPRFPIWHNSSFLHSVSYTELI